jgi:hypothetical protein
MAVGVGNSNLRWQQTLANNTLVSTLLVLKLSLESFCVYFLVIVFGISLFHLRSVKRTVFFKTHCAQDIFISSE